MTLKLRQHVESPPEVVTQPVNASGAASTGAAPEASPSISGWLGVFASMLPRRQAEGVREELEGHLRERVRDLMVGGMGESEATKRAIAELGEAAELAGKYRSLANEPRRRMAMYGTILGVAGAALALSVAAITGRGHPESEVSQERAKREAVSSLLAEALLQRQPEIRVPMLTELPLRVEMARPQVALAEVQIPSWKLADGAIAFEQKSSDEPEFSADVKFENTPAADVLQAVERFAKMPVQANWEQLQEAGLTPESQITLHAKGATAAMILRALNESTRVTGEAPIGWRATNGVLEIGLANHFDKREIKLVIYDLEGIIGARQNKYGEERKEIVEEIVKLISGFVYPEGWRDNGGDLAKMTVVGDRMIVHAPERFHAQIRWMLDQLPTEQEKKLGKAGDAGVRRFIIQHLTADEALQAIKSNQAIKAIDFSKFAVDQHTNSIVASVTEAESKLVQAALGQVDTQQARARRDERLSMMKELQDRQAHLAQVTKDLQVIQQALKWGQVEEAKRTSLFEALRTLQDQEAAAQVEVKALQDRLSQQSQGDAPVYVTGTIARPGAYSPTEGMTLRRLLAAAGGMPRDAVEVVISDRVDGEVKVHQTVKAGDLANPSGPDPVIQGGQLVSVR